MSNNTFFGNLILGGLVFVGGSLGLITHFNDQGLKDNLKKYEDSQKPVFATVVDETYINQLEPVDKHSRFFGYSNPTVTLKSAYTLKCKGEYGQLFGLSVIDAEDVKKEGLDQLIQSGTKISFPRGNYKKPKNDILRSYDDETYFNKNTQAGSKRADRIKVLNPK
jgi:hypothetical protein